jgi:hypothetical protein
MKNQTWIAIVVAATLLSAASCTREETNGTLQLGFQLSQEEVLKSVGTDRQVTAALVTIVNENGRLVYDHEYLPVYSFGDGYTSRSLKLPVGNYQLEAFMLVDSMGVVQWATPRVESSLAHLVNEPIPVHFSIYSDQTTTLPMQVVPTRDYQPSDFGYANFEIEFVEWFCLKVYYSSRCMEDWNDSILGPDGSEAPIYQPMLTVTTNNRVVLHEPLNPGLNRYRLPLLEKEYLLEATDCRGQVVYHEMFILPQLLEHGCLDNTLPLVINRDPVPGILITPEEVKEPTIRQGVFGHITVGLDYYMIIDTADLPPVVRDLYFYPYHVVDSLLVMSPMDCHFPIDWIQEEPVAIVRSNSAGVYQVPLEAGEYLYLVEDGGLWYWDAYISSHRPGHVEVYPESVTFRDIHILDCSMWMQPTD